MDKYIVQYKHSLSEHVCKSIISKFNASTCKQDGVTIGGLNKSIKDTSEVYINFGDPDWAEIENILHKELSSKVSDYYFNVYNHVDDNGNVTVLLNKEKILTDNKCFQIQKYDTCKGFYKYHSDNLIDYKNQRTRHITFIWYLNTVEEGGQTEFWGHYKIKPETGKLVIFPACWTYPHTGLMPISNDKYIITGWLYKDEIAEQYVNKTIKEMPQDSQRIHVNIDNNESAEESETKK